MSAQDATRAAVLALLDTITRQRRTLHELERREAQHSSLDVPLALRVQIDELREQVAAGQTRLEDMVPRLQPSLQQRVQTSRVRWLNDDTAHLQQLASVRQRKCNEMERRAASYGPGEAPIHLLNSLAAEREALADINQQLSHINTQMETETSRLERLHQGNGLTITIVTPDELLYEAEVPGSLLVAQLRTAFLEMWHPPPGSGWQHFVIRGERQSGVLPADFSLTRANVKSHDRLYLEPEVTMPSGGVHLNIENPGGDRFETKAPYDISVGHLAREFVSAQNWRWPDQSNDRQRPVVELLDARNPGTNRRLGENLTLMEACLQDGDVLRIYLETIAGPVQKGDTV